MKPIPITDLFRILAQAVNQALTVYVTLDTLHGTHSTTFLDCIFFIYNLKSVTGTDLVTRSSTRSKDQDLAAVYCPGI